MKKTPGDGSWSNIDPTGLNNLDNRLDAKNPDLPFLFINTSLVRGVHCLSALVNLVFIGLSICPCAELKHYTSGWIHSFTQVRAYQ